MVGEWHSRRSAIRHGRKRPRDALLVIPGSAL
jgi:hypothetical protein